MCVTVRHLQNSVNTTLEPASKTSSKVEKTETIEKINLNIKDQTNIHEHKKSDLSEKDLVKLVNDTVNSCTPANEKYYDKTMSLTSTLLSAVDLPLVTTPLKLVADFNSVDKSTEKLSKHLQEKNYLELTTESISSVKSSWGTFVGGVKLVEISADLGANYGFLSSKATSFIEKKASKVSLTASKISIPFAVIGTGLSGVDFIKEASDLSNRKKILKEIETIKNKPNLNNKELVLKAENKVKKDIKVLKINTTLKGTSFVLSAISTSTLIMSVKNPQKAKTYLTISVASSIASGVTSVFSDAGYRKATGNFIADKKNKLFNIVK